MKRITITLALILLVNLVASSLMAAGVPGTINYQGRITDGAGNTVADGVYTLIFTIYAIPTGGVALWTETKQVSVTKGLFTTELGAGTAIPANLFSGDASRYLGVAVNSDPEMPRVAFSSVAYSYQAKDADLARVAQDLTCAGCVDAGNIATNAIGASEIADGSVGTAEIGTAAVNTDEIATGAVGALEIAAGAVGTSEVADGSLTAGDIDDEPGVASNTADVGINLDGSVQTLLSRTLTADTAGYVLVIASGQVQVTHLQGTSSQAYFGVSSTSGVFPANQDLLLDLSSLPSGIYNFPVTVHGLFATPGGGDTFYFLGHEVSGNIGIQEMQLTLIYFPTAYGTVVSTSAEPGESMPDK